MNNPSRAHNHADSLSPPKVIFLDRDGVINIKLPEDNYISNIQQFKFIPGAIEALKILRDLEYLLIVVTNQRGIARGLMSGEDLTIVHDYMSEKLSSNGVTLDGIYYCPHDKHDDCSCRKPKPGMLLSAMEDFDIDLSRSFLVGDSDSDIRAGKSVGTHTVLIGDKSNIQADFVFPSLLNFALYLKNTKVDFE